MTTFELTYKTPFLNIYNFFRYRIFQDRNNSDLYFCLLHNRMYKIQKHEEKKEPCYLLGFGVWIFLSVYRWINCELPCMHVCLCVCYLEKCPFVQMKIVVIYCRLSGGQHHGEWLYVFMYICVRSNDMHWIIYITIHKHVTIGYEL